MDIKDELQVSYTISLTSTRWLVDLTNRRHIVDTPPTNKPKQPKRGTRSQNIPPFHVEQQNIVWNSRTYCGGGHIYIRSVHISGQTAFLRRGCTFSQCTFHTNLSVHCTRTYCTSYNILSVFRTLSSLFRFILNQGCLLQISILFRMAVCYSEKSLHIQI